MGGGDHQGQIDRYALSSIKLKAFEQIIILKMYTYTYIDNYIQIRGSELFKLRPSQG